MRYQYLMYICYKKKPPFFYDNKQQVKVVIPDSDPVMIICQQNMHKANLNF